MAASIDAGSPMSICSGTALPPVRQMASATRVADSSERSATPTAAPARASVVAIASPIPLPPPVTRATSPDRSIAMLIGSVRPCVLGEIRIAFLCERGGTLFGLVGLQKDVESVFRQERE